MEIVDFCEQSGHLAGCEQHAVKLSICRLLLNNIDRLITGSSNDLGLIEHMRSEMRRSLPKRQAFKDRSHSGCLFDCGRVERGNPYTATCYADGEALSFEPSQRLANRDMARTKLFRDMLLPQPRIGPEHACDYPVGQDAADAVCDCIFCGAHPSVDKFFKACCRGRERWSHDISLRGMIMSSFECPF